MYINVAKEITIAKFLKAMYQPAILTLICAITLATSSPVTVFVGEKTLTSNNGTLLNNISSNVITLQVVLPTLAMFDKTKFTTKPGTRKTSLKTYVKKPSTVSKIPAYSTYFVVFI